MNPLEQRVQDLEQEVAELKKLLTAGRKSKGSQDFVDNDVVVLRNLYAKKIYTKRSGSYVELTS